MGSTAGLSKVTFELPPVLCGNVTHWGGGSHFCSRGRREDTYHTTSVILHTLGPKPWPLNPTLGSGSSEFVGDIVAGM